MKRSLREKQDRRNPVKRNLRKKRPAKNPAKKSLRKVKRQAGIRLTEDRPVKAETERERKEPRRSFRNFITAKTDFAER